MSEELKPTDRAIGALNAARAEEKRQAVVKSKRAR